MAGGCHRNRVTAKTLQTIICVNSLSNPQNFISGPAHWKKSCQTGKKQSPIKISLDSTTYDHHLGTFSFVNYDVANMYSSVINNGHSSKYVCLPLKKMNLQKIKYRNKCAITMYIWYKYLRVYPGIEIGPRFLCCVVEHIINCVRLMYGTNQIHS